MQRSVLLLGTLVGLGITSDYPLAAAAPAEPASAAQPASQQPAAAATYTSAEKSDSKKPDSRIARERELFGNPDYRAARRDQERIIVRAINTDVRFALGLSSSVADDFIELLTDHRMSSIEDQLIPPSPDERLLRLQRRDQEIAELIGADGLRGYKDYAAGLFQRGAARQLSMRLGAIGLPLSQEQVENVVAALRTLPIRQPQAVLLSPNNTHAQEEQQRIAISPHLSPQQLAEYERLLDGIRQQRDATKRMADAERAMWPAATNGIRTR